MVRDLTICQAARIADCHVNTIKNYERKGFTHPLRDRNNHRRYSLQEALKLKEILSARLRGQDEQEKNS